MIHQTTWDGQTVSDGTNFKQILTMRTLVGDTNLDGKVDQADYVNIIANMGRVGTTYFEGDLNHDGVVTPDDLALVTANLGAGAAFAAGPQQVPNPATVPVQELPNSLRSRSPGSPLASARPPSTLTWPTLHTDRFTRSKETTSSDSLSRVPVLFRSASPIIVGACD
jgi:hypothetical protein